MTFSIPRTNVIASDEGFRVEVIAPAEIRYTDAGTTWRLQMEYLTDDAVPIVVYQDTLITTGGSPQGRRPSPAERDRIIGNIRRAMRFRKTKIQVM